MPLQATTTGESGQEEFQESQVDGHNPCGVPLTPNEISPEIKGSRVTGLIPPDSPELPASPQVPEPPAPGDDGCKPPQRKKAKTAGKDALIPNPPELPPALAQLAVPTGSEIPKSDLDGQSKLKKQLEQEEKEQAAKKKQDAADKRAKAAADAVAKMEKKLELAKAKAAAIQNKSQPVRRKLDAQFANVQENKQGPPVSPEHSKRKRPNIKLTPKAKEFALKAATPKQGKGNSPKDAKARSMDKACSALETLRGLELTDMTLPKPGELTKKILVCTYMHILMHAIVLGKTSTKKCRY